VNCRKIRTDLDFPLSLVIPAQAGIQNLFLCNVKQYSGLQARCDAPLGSRLRGNDSNFKDVRVTGIWDFPSRMPSGPADSTVSQAGSLLLETLLPLRGNDKPEKMAEQDGRTSAAAHCEQVK
jgi:hypothetical protein